jgi:glutamine---fructose-6-phosphate transaminase (isomerizing)
MPSQLAREIARQPEVLAHLLERELDRIGEIAAALRPFDYVVIAARGSSDHAAIYAKYAWAALGGAAVALATPSLHTLYGAPPRMANALVVGISQSGQSPDVVAVLAEAERQGRPTLAITNDGDSPLAEAAHAVIELGTGEERSVAATMTYTAELAVVAALAAHWSQQPERLAELRRIPNLMSATLARAGEIAARAERYRYMQSCAIIGRGFNTATAYELGLKLKELTYVTATSYSSADFRHGPIATVEEGSPVILIMPTGSTYTDMRDLSDDLRARGAELLVISDQPEALAPTRTSMPLPEGVPEWLSPLVTILPGQRFALELALTKGFDPDVPRGLRKVTKTT